MELLNEIHKAYRDYIKNNYGQNPSWLIVDKDTHTALEKIGRQFNTLDQPLETSMIYGMKIAIVDQKVINHIIEVA